MQSRIGKGMAGRARRLAVVSVAAAAVLVAPWLAGSADAAAMDASRQSGEIGFQTAGGESTQIKLKPHLTFHPPPPPY